MRWVLIGSVTTLLAASSCSLIVDNKGEQCTRTAECARFRNARCDLTTFTCKDVATGDLPSEQPLASADAGGRILDAGATVAPVDGALAARGADAGCVPRDTVSTLNACTNARCQPFDNRARLSRLAADGRLPPLPQPREAGTQVQ